MTEHLSHAELNAVVDGELAPADLARVSEHLSVCLACSSQTLSLGLLKRRVAEAGAPPVSPAGFEQRMRSAIAPSSTKAAPRRWIPVAAVIALCAAILPIQQFTQHRTQQDALASEALDHHIATLAAGAPPQVISSDRHTVKPWFQGKLPFSFNLPASLPPGTTLDGADLTYLHGQPAAQLLFSIGKHRASVFLQQSGSPAPSNVTRAGFHIAEFHTAQLEGFAVSDADAAAVGSLIDSVRAAQ